MKNLKKVLALVVVFTMVLSTVAFASYPDVDADADYAGAVELLSALSILKGDDTGNFNPDQNITRAEFAAVVCRALGLEGSANGAMGATAFTDVAADHWASGYINLAAQQNIINGMGDGTFAPEANVTYTQAVKMLVVAMGYEPMAEKKGGYPAGYLATANSIGLTDGVPSTASDVAALRSTVAMLTANAMELPVMEQSTYGTDSLFKVYDGESMPFKSLLTNMNIYIATGIVGEYADDEKATVDFDVTMDSDDGQFADGNDKTFFVNDSNIADYKNEKVNAYVEKKNSKYYVLAVVSADEGSTFETDIALLDETMDIDANGYVEYYESADDNNASKLYINRVDTNDDNKADTEDIKIYVNGFSTDDDFATVYNKFKAKDASVKFIENGDDKYYDAVEFTVFDYYVVTNVEAARDKVSFAGTTVSFAEVLDDEDYTLVFVDADGKELSISDFKEDDVVAVVAQNAGTNRSFKPGTNNKTVTYMNLGDSTVTGSVTGYNKAEGYILVDGNAYDVISGATIGTDKGYASGDEGTYFLTISGKIFDFDGTKGSVGNYAYVLGSYAEKDELNGGVSLQVKLLTSDQGIVTVDAHTTFEYSYYEEITKEDGSKEVVLTEKTLKATDALSKFTAFTDAYKVTVTAGKVDVKANSLVTYKLNANNYLKSITAVDDVTALAANSEFDADYAELGKNELEDTVKVFVLNANDINDSYVTTNSVLVNDQVYAGFVADVDDDTDKYSVAIITEGIGGLDKSAAISVASKVNTTVYNEEEATEVYAYTESGSEAVKYIFTDDSKAYGNYDITDLNGGSVFLCMAGENGVVTSYAILGVVANGELVVDTDAINLAKGEMANVTYDYAYGDIDTISENKITLTNGKSFKVGSTANQYTYDYKKGAVIYTDDYMAVSTVGDKAEDGKANFVFFKLYNGNKVADVITFADKN